MLVHFSSRLEYKGVGWTFGYCPTCQENGAIRLEEVFEVCYLWDLICLTRSFRGEIARCDFCERRVDEYSEENGIPLAEWDPTDGLPTLLAKLGLPIPLGTSKPVSDAQLHSLLSSVEKKSAINRQELTLIGAGAGFLMGLVISVPLGLWLYEPKPMGNHKDNFGIVLVAIIIGGVGGVVLGVIAEGLFRGNRIAHRRIEAAQTKYRIYPRRLEELSEKYSRRIRRAVKKVCNRCRG